MAASRCCGRGQEQIVPGRAGTEMHNRRNRRQGRPMNLRAPEPDESPLSVVMHTRPTIPCSRPNSPRYLVALPGILVVAIIGAPGCANVRWKGDKHVREDRNRAMVTLLREAEEDPVRGCETLLPRAIDSGRFSDDCFFDSCQEIALLKNALDLACACKTKLFAKSETAPARLNELGNATLDNLVAITNSLNQSPAVLSAAVAALRRRIPEAGLDEISSLYLGGREAFVPGVLLPARFKDHIVSCSAPPRNPSESKPHKVTHRSFLYGEDPTLRLMIEERTRILVQAVVDEQKAAEKARQAAKLEERSNKAAADRQARSSQIRGLLATALDLARKGDIAWAEKRISEAKGIRSVDDEALQGEEDRVLLAEIAAAEAAIAETPSAKRRAKERQREEARLDQARQREEARLEREAEKRDREEKRKEDASGRRVIGLVLDYTDRIERDMRHLVDVFASLHPPAREPTRAEKEIVYAPMRQLCTTIKAMRMQLPDYAEEQVLRLVYGRFARTEGSRDANTAMGILAQYLEGDCHKTHQGAFSHQ